MNLPKTFLKAFLPVCLLLIPIMAGAVTQKEMEQARTIAAKSYLRYANDGSGYLDDLEPTTMEELEAALKSKEKENIKAFKAIPVPSDYQSWNKDKLLEYWAVTAFQNKGLLEKGRGGRIRARSLINKMTIAAPQAVPASTAQPQETNVMAAGGSGEKAESAANELKELKADEDAIQAELEAEEEEVNTEKATNYTWVYIMILAILVGVVIALVVFAANVVKRNGGKQGLVSPAFSGNQPDKESIERFESLIADKDMEIAMLKKKLETASRQNSDLRNKVDSLTSELAAFHTARLSSPLEAPERKEPEKEKVTTQKLGTLRSIFLGRANSRGIFVRADRSLNPGHSIFVLETADGFSGSFRVVDSPEVWNLALSNPKEYLETACTGRYLDDPGPANQIITESPGTAVFEGGCWRVIRKARIRYEV